MKQVHCGILGRISRRQGLFHFDKITKEGPLVDRVGEDGRRNRVVLFQKRRALRRIGFIGLSSELFYRGHKLFRRMRNARHGMKELPLKNGEETRMVDMITEFM